MAVTQNSYTGNGTTTNYSFTFPYLKQSEIKASLDATVTTAFSIPNATTVQFNTAPANGVKIKIYRETDSDSLAATFYAGSAIKSEDLNDNFTQNLYATQEVTERYLSNLGGTMTGDLALGEDVVVKFEGATDNDYETTLTVVDPTADRTITLPNITGTIVTTGDTGTVATGMIANDAINGTKIADDSVDSEHIAADSLDSEHYAPGSVDTTALGTDSVTTVKITDLNVTTAKIANLAVGTNQIAADAINGGKIADDSIDSEHYVADSIDTEHYAPNSVDADALAHTSVTAGTYTATDLTVDAQGRITAASSGTIARSEIAADAIDGTKLADNAVDSEHYTDGSIDHVHLANDVIDGDNIQDDVINSEHYAAGSIDTEHIADLQVTTAKIAADAIDGTKIADNAIGSEHVAANSIGDSEIATGALDNRYYTETESDARYFNISTGDTIKDGDTFPDNDTTIATTAAINDRIIDLVDDVGGFVPIANETSFPAANPDVNNGAGTLVSIKALASNLVSNGSGVATISNGAGSGNTVTITGLANSTTYAATFGLIVETTSTLHTYTFHRQVPKATEVSTVAGSISNVNTVAGSISNVNTVASNNSNVTTVAGVSSNVTTVAGVASNVTTVAGIASDVTAVAGDATDIGAVAAKATEIGRLGTADAVADMNTLGTTAIVSDLDTCATNVSNINTAAGSISNINTVATNISNVNDFSDKYRVASSAPTSSLDTGDLYFDTTANELKVYNGSAWQGGVTATGNLAGLGANTFTGSQSLGDNLKVQLGAGDDLQIYHNGTSSYVVDTTSDLYLQSTNDDIIIKAADDIWCQVQGGENAITMVGNGKVELFYDNSVKFETTSGGAQIEGNLVLNGYIDMGAGSIYTDDNCKVRLGTGDDFQIYHDGTNSLLANSTGRLIVHVNGNESAIDMHPNGAVELYYDNSKKAQTASDGLTVVGDLNLNSDDNHKIKFGSGNDLQIYHDGTDSYLDNSTGNLQLTTNEFRVKSKTGGEAHIQSSDEGDVQLYYDGVKKFFTHSAGCQIDGNLSMTLADGYEIRLGASNDLKLLHDGNNSYVSDQGTGGLKLLTSQLMVHNQGGNEYQIRATENGSTELYYDNSLKLETTSYGVFVGGTFRADVIDMQDNKKANWGNDDDLEIYHDGSNSHIHDSGSGVVYLRTNNLQVNNAANNEAMINAAENGSVELYYDNSKKFETTAAGVRIYNTAAADAELRITASEGRPSVIIMDADDADDNADIWRLKASDDGSYYLQNYASGSYETNIKANGNGNVELYYDNSKKFETLSTGWGVADTIEWNATQGSLDLWDNKKVSLGNSRDLQIYHDGSNSYIVNGASGGNLYLQTYGENSVKAIANGAVELYHNGSKKLETTSSGINVIGSITQNGAALGGGVWERFGAVTITSNSSDVDLTWASNSSIVSDYEKIKFEFYNIKKTSDNIIELKFFDTSGNIISAGYNLTSSYSTRQDESNSFTEFRQNNDDKIELNKDAAGENTSGWFEMYDPFDNISTDGPIRYFWNLWNTRMANATDSNDRSYFTQGAGMLANGLAWDTKICGIRLTSGTYTSGKIVAYGLKNS